VARKQGAGAGQQVSWYKNPGVSHTLLGSLLQTLVPFWTQFPHMKSGVRHRFQIPSIPKC
jgi:hypothetical protein